MRLLIITQKVDKQDPILGFFHRWIEEFAKHCESIIVICLQKGEYNLPENVRVLSLGKEEGGSRFHKTVRYIARFYAYIWKERNSYNSVFVHMNPEYVVLGGLFWRLLGKKIALWYTHKSVNIKLRVAIFFSDQVFSASKKSFRLETKKLKVVGHGIDTIKFNCPPKSIGGSLKIIGVGRITQIKGCDTIIKTAGELKRSGYTDILVVFVGDTVTPDDEVYKKNLMVLVKKLDLKTNIVFKGNLDENKLIKEYCEGDIFINPTPSGGVDKVVLEAMASKRVVFSSNEAFIGLFGKYEERLLFPYEDHVRLAEMITNLIYEDDYQQVAEFLHQRVVKNSDIKNLVKVLVENI